VVKVSASEFESIAEHFFAIFHI